MVGVPSGTVRGLPPSGISVEALAPRAFVAGKRGLQQGGGGGGGWPIHDIGITNIVWCMTDTRRIVCMYGGRLTRYIYIYIYI